MQACGIASADDGFGDVVAACRYSGAHAFDGELGRVQPEVEDRHGIALFVGAVNHAFEASGGQCGFDGEVFVSSEQVVHFQQHEFAGLDGCRVRAERGETLGEFVGVHELAASQHFRQQRIGGRGFPGSVTSRYDV